MTKQGKQRYSVAR